MRSIRAECAGQRIGACATIKAVVASRVADALARTCANDRITRTVAQRQVNASFSRKCCKINGAPTDKIDATHIRQLGESSQLGCGHGQECWGAVGAPIAGYAQGFYVAERRFADVNGIGCKIAGPTIFGPSMYPSRAEIKLKRVISAATVDGSC